jgi:hypothetical protein
MTSYQVIAPIFLVRFQGLHGVFFRAWSPRRYGPAYTYDIVIEAEDDQHPAMNIEYTDALQRVMDRVGGDRQFVDLTTDYHCPTPIEKRGDSLYVITLRDSPFSPVFFLREDAELYLDHLAQSFLEQRAFLELREVGHSVL